MEGYVEQRRDVTKEKKRSGNGVNWRNEKEERKQKGVQGEGVGGI